MNYDLTQGNITGNLIKFSIPLMIGNMLQQLYNIADTLIVGHYLGANALAAVGSTYTLMIFLTSILLGLCMGSSVFFSIQFGKKDNHRLKQGMFLAFVIIGIITAVLNGGVYLGTDWLIGFLRVPMEVRSLMKEYMVWIFTGIFATFLYNFFSNLLRGLGNSVVPLYFLAIASVLNIVLDLAFVVGLKWGVAGAAIATVISQYVSAVGIIIYSIRKCSFLKIKKEHCKWDKEIVKEISSLSGLTCIQQSIMNFGILLVQGLVNSFGTVVMAAFAVAVKIDTFAYSPVQDFGNAFSVFVAQNYGAGEKKRIRQGMKSAAGVVFVFCVMVSLLVCILAEPLMEMFVGAESTDIIQVGVGYLRIEAAFYLGIGFLFLFYGFFRAVKRPGISVILTVISLGTRVILAYVLSAVPAIGVSGIWAAVPIGWILADITGGFFLLHSKWSQNL